MTSAEGSISEFMSSLTSVIGLNGGGGGALLHPNNRTALTATSKKAARILLVYYGIHRGSLTIRPSVRNRWYFVKTCVVRSPGIAVPRIIENVSIDTGRTTVSSGS